MTSFSTSIQIGDKVREVDFPHCMGVVTEHMQDQNGVIVVFVSADGHLFSAYDYQLEWVD